MRVFLILLGLLLMIGGGAVAGAQYAPPDLLTMLDSVPPQVRDFLLTPTALYAGAGAAGFGFLLVIIAVVTGGKKKAAKAKPESAKPAKAAAKPAEPKAAASAPPAAAPIAAAPAPKPAPVAPVPAPATAKAPEPKSPEPRPAPAPHPAMAAAAPTPAPAPVPAPPAAPKPKPQASAQPPASAQASAEAPTVSETGDRISMAEAVRNSPRLHNRKRVSDLVTINDALKAYFKKNGAYPAVAGLAGLIERGEAWIPGLAPDFLPELPRDPATSADGGGPQYVYASDGKDYKLLAQNVSLVGGTSVEVLGVKIDHTRKPTMENASFGYWTPGFAEA